MLGLCNLPILLRREGSVALPVTAALSPPLALLQHTVHLSSLISLMP